MHVSEDDLILHFYGEAPADEQRIDEHLRSCAACQTAWTELTDTLKLVDAATTPEPGPGFERVMWARVQRELPSAPARQWSFRAMAPMTALAASLVAAVALGYAWIARSQVAPAVVAPLHDAPTAIRTASTSVNPSKARERVLLTALGDHFAQTEVLLVELMNAPESGAGAEFEFERASADDLVASGRLYRETARQSGDLQLAQMLDDLESVLVEVARSPNKMTRKDFNSLRTRIDSNGLLFKVRAVTNQIHDRQQDLMTVSEGPL
jgi:hypothetical protein